MGGMMGFVEAIRSVFKNSRKMTGRATRSEYWFFYLFFLMGLIPVAIAGGFLANAMNEASPIHYNPLAGKVFLAMVVVYTAIMFFPLLGVSIRRLHDIGHSAWFLLLYLIPLGGPIMLVVFTLPGTKGPNDFGEDPSGNAVRFAKMF